MIQQFVDKFQENKIKLAQELVDNEPVDYTELVKRVIKLFANGKGTPDPERVHLIDDGDYQGTLVFIIAEQGYQPDKYWSAKVAYGSCSGCDTLEGIQQDSKGEEKVKDYMTLALHIVQDLKEF
jgi:hypothetical protein